MLGPVHVREEASEWILDDRTDAYGGGEVENEWAIRDELVDEPLVEDCSLDETKIRVTKVVDEIPLGTRAEVIQHSHLSALLDQAVNEVRPDEASAACDENVPGQDVYALGEECGNCVTGTTNSRHSAPKRAQLSRSDSRCSGSEPGKSLAYNTRSMR